jgi:hypothetical protein
MRTPHPRAKPARRALELNIWTQNADRITCTRERLGAISVDSGFYLCMATMETAVTRRLTGFLTLVVVLCTQGVPLAACATNCPVKQPKTMECCVSGKGPTRGAALSAASCCHFEAATPSAQLAGTVPPPQRSQEKESLLAILTPSPALYSPAPERQGWEFPQPRSTDSPISLHNTLRL